MSRNAPEKLVKIHITSGGGQYVNADELLAREEVREVIQRMAEVPVEGNSVDQNQINRNR